MEISCQAGVKERSQKAGSTSVQGTCNKEATPEQCTGESGFLNGSINVCFIYDHVLNTY